MTFAPGWLATPSTYVELQGRTAWGDRSSLAFHVTSGDWQESDQWLTAVMTAFGSPARPVPVGGAGRFDGRMLGAFRRPRVEGRFAGERMRAWDVEWGAAAADLVIENSYVDITGARIARGASTMDVDGRFSLGFPRKDRGEELNARVRMTGRPVDDLKHAFELDDYQVDGALSGEFRIYGPYRGPFGFGRMQIDAGSSYGEAFDTASAALRFEGTGVRLDTLDVRKSTGSVTGAAFVGWDGTYSFNADGLRVPVESLAVARFPTLPLTGFLDFSATGSGTFDEPRYSVRGRVVDLFAAEEGLGQLTGRIEVRGDELSIAQLEGASPRLAVSGGGRITLSPTRDADLTLRFSRTSIDPYVRLLEPRLSPFTTVVASGGFRVVGPLRDSTRLSVQGSIEDVDLRLFDYHLRNDGPIVLSLKDDVARIEKLRVVGDGTTLELAGDARLTEDRLRVRALGDANLSLLQGFFRDIRSSGSAKVQAEITGPTRGPVITGSAVLTDGRIRYFGLPHSLDGVNGRVEFDAAGLRIDTLAGRMGGGEVRFGGRIGIRDGTLESYNLTAVGRDMRIRYPEGFRSQVDTDLALRGPVGAPVLSGNVHVKDALFIKSVDTEGTGLFGLAASAGPATATPTAAPSGFPLRFDLKIDAPSALRIDSPSARLVSSADLTLRGTYDRPSLMGRADIDRGELLLEGNRYLVTRGAIEFNNPTRIDPFFDIEAETRARAPGQTYRVTFRASGTRDRFAWDFSSDPPLSTVDILAHAVRRPARPARRRAERAAPPRPDRAGAAGGAGDAAARQPDLVRGRQGRAQDLRCRHRADHALARRLLQPAVGPPEPDRAADHRQAPVEQAVRHLRPAADLVAARAAAPHRVQPERSLRVDPVAQRRRDLRDRRAHEARVLVRCRRDTQQRWHAAVVGMLAALALAAPAGSQPAAQAAAQPAAAARGQPADARILHRGGLGRPHRARSRRHDCRRGDRRAALGLAGRDAARIAALARRPADDAAALLQHRDVPGGRRDDRAGRRRRRHPRDLPADAGPHRERADVPRRPRPRRR